MFSNMRLDELVARARTLYTNARDDAQIAALLANPYGYKADDYAAGLALVQEVTNLDADQEREYAEQYAATAAAAADLATLEGLFVAHRRLARTRHKRGTAGYNGLNLAGGIADDDEGLLAQAEAFYRMLEADPSLAEGIRGLNAAAVTDGLARVAAARKAYDAQARETGEAQRATHLRDDAAGRLRAHASELAEVARVGLADYPQLREKLGLLERS